MKTGDLEKQFGISRQTIYNWVDRFPKYFSDAAQRIGTKHRVFTADDYLILATIADLSRTGLGYEAIEVRLSEGYRVDDTAAFTVGYADGRMVPATAVEQIIDSAEIRVALERMTAERDRLLTMLEKASEHEKELLAKVDALQREIADLRERVGRAEGKLELYQKRNDLPF